MANTNQYNPSAIILKVDGTTVTDFAADSFVVFTPDQSIGGAYYGADGGATVFASSVAGGKLKMSLRQNSQGAAAMSKLATKQFALGRSGKAVTLLDVSLYDSISKSTLRGPAIFSDMPEKGFGKEPGTRDFTMVMPQGLANDTELAS